MRWSLRLVDFRSIPVRIHVTFALLMAFLFWRTGTLAGVKPALIQTLVMVLLFASVALHEVGHAIVAQRHDISIEEITLYPFGGVARLTRRPPTGSAELRIAVAGPAVNLVLAAAILAATGGRVVAPTASTTLGIAAFVFWGNLVIAGFNLLPAFPLDGGRVLRGALASKLGWTRATVWSASAGQVLAVVLMLAGIVHEPWLVLAGLLLFPGANSELRIALGLKALARRRVREVMTDRIQLVGPDASLRALAQASRETPGCDFVVHDGVRAIGFLPAARLWSIVTSPERSERTAGDAALPIGTPVSADAPLPEVLATLQGDQERAAPVIDESGAIIGVVRHAAIARAQSLIRAFTARYGTGDGAPS